MGRGEGLSERERVREREKIEIDRHRLTQIAGKRRTQGRSVGKNGAQIKGDLLCGRIEKIAINK